MVPFASPVCASRGHLGVGKKIFGMFAAKPCDVADHPVSDQFACKLAGGRADVVEPDHVDRPSRCRGPSRGCLRATRPAVFRRTQACPSCKGRFGDFAVGVLRGGDDDGLYRGIIHETRQSSVPAANPKAAIFLGRGRIVAQTISSAGAVPCRTPHRQRHGDRMCLAHIAAANDADPNLVMFRPSPKYGLQPVAKLVS